MALESIKDLCLPCKTLLRRWMVHGQDIHGLYGAIRICPCLVVRHTRNKLRYSIYSHRASERLHSYYSLFEIIYRKFSVTICHLFFKLFQLQYFHKYRMYLKSMIVGKIQDYIMLKGVIYYYFCF